MNDFRFAPTSVRGAVALGDRVSCRTAREPDPPAGGQRSGLTLFTVSPPYERTVAQAGIRSLDPAAAGPGTVLGLDIGAGRIDWDYLAEAVRQLRGRFPLSPIVLQVDLAAEDPLYVATRARGLPIRGVLTRGSSPATALRRRLTHQASLAGEIVEWLNFRGYRFSPALAELIRQFVARAPYHSAVATLCREIGAAESSARFRFQKKQLPPPSRWLQAARALHAVLQMQAHPERPLSALAYRMGYRDHSALSHQIHRAFGVRPSEVRPLLGWEWLLEAWMERHRGRRGARPRLAAGAGMAAG